jgi:hypothetical protein
VTTFDSEHQLYIDDSKLAARDQQVWYYPVISNFYVFKYCQFRFCPC